MTKISIRLLLCVLVCSGMQPLSQAQDSWKLQPLKYNNPGLKVDLGVGLWAWPMPMDYDNDGDMDLLVACPDKPSNGVYFFENASNDASTKMPVFKPSVRLGKAVNNLQVSFVDNQPRILRPGSEILRDESGKWLWDKPSKVYARSNVHENRVRGNMWRYVDFEGDGDQDIIVGAGDWTDYGWDHAYDAAGRWHNGPLHGYVYLITNEGTSSEPKYSSTPQRVQAGGGDIDVYGWPSPNFGDFDGDGDLDLLCGEFLDGFTYFENVGSRSTPEYAAGIKLTDQRDRPLKMHLQMITPTAIDWDKDGDLDLIVGDEDGRVALVENTGKLRQNRPVFLRPKYFKQEADTLKFGALATPFAYDWDGDGDEDIVCGNTAGNIALFDNLGAGENGQPKWDAPELLRVAIGGGQSKPFRILAGPSGSIQGPCEAKWGYTTLSVADWDSDGDPDIIYNSILSRVGLLRNDKGTLRDVDLKLETSEQPPQWYWWQTKSPSAVTQWRTTPVAIDFDADKQLDLVMLDQEGFLTVRSGGGKAERIFVDENNQPIQLNAKSCGGSGRVKLSVVDWDGDGRLDVLINSENATWYRNVSTNDGKVLLKRVGNLARRNVAGHTSSPANCDLDHDGKPDLLVGAENGRIYFIKHDDCITVAPEQMNASLNSSDDKSRMAGLVTESQIFAKPPTPQCHASTICETSRGLVAAWFAGTREKNKDVGIWTSYHDGTRWTSPKLVADGVQHGDLRYPCWNPVLFQPPGDAPTLLFFKVGPDPRQWWGEVMVSYDRGRTFRDRQRLPSGIDGPVRCKPILLGNQLLCGSSTEYDGWRIHFEKINLSGGRLDGTWNRIGPINDASRFNAIQPTFVQHADGKLRVLCRTQEGVVATASSTDNGETWSSLEATNLPNPNAGIDVVNLKDGRFLLIYNHLGSGKSGWGRRGMLNLALSADGVNWNHVGVLEQEKSAEFSYPAIIQSDDGLVHATYTWKRTHIKHVVIDPDKLVPTEIPE